MSIASCEGQELRNTVKDMFEKERNQMREMYPERYRLLASDLRNNGWADENCGDVGFVRPKF